MATGRHDCKHYGLFTLADNYVSQEGCELLQQYCDYEGGDAEECDYFDDSSSGGCYMTSACVDYMGKTDDCVELETMRKFRDEKLRFMPGGKAMIKEYYDVAPGVVMAINSSEKKDEYYQDIYNTIVRCMEKIEAKEDKRAVALYLGMFYKYKDLFNL